MRFLVLIVPLLISQACVAPREPDTGGKTRFLPEAQLQELSVDSSIGPNPSEAPANAPKPYAFTLALISIVEPSWACYAVYADNTLKLTRGDNVISEKRLTPTQSQSLHALLDSFDKDAWSGFYVRLHVLDGDFVNCRVNRGDEVLQFRGNNGSPEGFAALLSEIEAIARNNFFPDYWPEQEKNSRRYESEADLLRHLIPGALNRAEQ